MHLLDSQPLTNTQSQSKLSFTTTGSDTWPVWDRFISLDDEQLFHIGNICGTCEFFFRRMTDREVTSFEIEQIRSQLASGIERIDETAMSFSAVIPNGEYVIALFEAQPHRSGQNGTPDYFSHEQRLAWPDYDDDTPPNTSYFRSNARALQDQQMLFEFFIPLYDPKLLNDDRVKHYVDALQSNRKPTAVALSVLDVKSSMSFPEDENGNEIEPEYPTHWCLGNYLLDGHHKVAASHATGKPITVLSFISRDHSWKLIDELMAEYQRDR